MWYINTMKIVLSLKGKEIHVCYNMDELQELYTHWKAQSPKDKCNIILLLWGPYSSQVHRDRKVQNGVLRWWGRGVGISVLMGARLSISRWKSSRSGWWQWLNNVTLNNSHDSKFYIICILPQWKHWRRRRHLASLRIPCQGKKFMNPEGTTGSQQHLLFVLQLVWAGIWDRWTVQLAPHRTSEIFSEIFRRPCRGSVNSLRSQFCLSFSAPQVLQTGLRPTLYVSCGQTPGEVKLQEALPPNSTTESSEGWSALHQVARPQKLKDTRLSLEAPSTGR